MLVCTCPPPPSGFTISDYSDLAQVVIAAINLLLAGYIIFYQIRKDRRTENDTARLNEQNIKLQWFKELVVQPNIGAVNAFYENISSIKERITSNDLDDGDKEKINDFVKEELSKLRKSFVDVLIQVDKPFGEQVKNNLDNLVDGITESIFNEELKLKLPSVYEKNIGSKISYSKNTLFALIYNYKGI